MRGDRRPLPLLAPVFALALAACGPPPVAPASSAARAQVRVVMYTTRWCPVCSSARSWFRARGIPVDERDVETDRAAAVAHRQIEPGRSVPVISVEGGGVLVGFVPEELRRLVDTAAHRRCRAVPVPEGCSSGSELRR